MERNTADHVLEDIGTLMNFLTPVASKCSALGVQLGLKVWQINNIEKNNRKCESQLQAILVERLNQDQPLTCRVLVAALRADSVRETRVAHQIESHYSTSCLPPPPILHGFHHSYPPYPNQGLQYNTTPYHSMQQCPPSNLPHHYAANPHITAHGPSRPPVPTSANPSASPQASGVASQRTAQEAENVELKAGLPVFGTGAASYGMVSVESVLAKLGSDLPEYAQVDRKQCIVHVKKEVQVNTTVHVYITLCDSAGFPCSVEQKVLVNVVSCSGTGDSLTTDVKPLSLSRYMACFTPTPSTRGRRKVTVEVNGERIDDDLISVLVQCPPQLLHRQTPKTIDNIWHRGCIKSIGDRVICLTRAEAVVATLKSGEPQVVYIDGRVVTPAYKLKLPLHCRLRQWAPDEIAVGNNSLYVTDNHNNKVHRINLSDGTYIGSTGSKGCGEGQFNRPNGLCFAQDNHLYVCDSDNHRIQVFDQDLEFCRTFGEMGTDSGCFLWPSNVASTSTKDGKVLLYVSELHNHRVQCVTAAGVHVRFIGSCSGTGESRLRRPNILHTHSSYLFISDDRGVIVFTTSGEFVTRFATELCKVGDYPIEGLTVSSDGFVYVYHCPQNRIFLY